MLERYFVRPTTVDRLRSSWLGEPLDRYVAWLTKEGYAARNVHHRVPIVIQFGAFATARGVHTIAELPAQVDDFVEYWISRHDHRRQIKPTRETLRKEIRGPIEQSLRVAIPGFQGRGRARRRLTPFTGSVPRFFQYLREERGLREATLDGYGHHLLRFEEYLRSIQLDPLSGLSSVVLSSFITDTSHGLSKKSIGDRCGILRVFLRYLYREGYLAHDLSGAVEGPQVYRLSTIPRSITWDDVRRMLDGVDRRTVAGRRDYAILLLLVSYGLRAREVAALTVDNLDWGNERLRIPERKAGHSTAYPLSPVVGEAILAYLRSGRPTTTDRHLFFRVVAPLTPITYNVVGCQAAHYLRKAGVQVPRPGSHTLRHTCVQRLVDGGFSLKTIGDYVGHRQPSSTQIYSKVSLDALRAVACGPGEEVL